MIDFTTRPTRQAMGLPAGQGSVTYPKGNARPIDTTLRFPTGDVPVTLFEIDISTNSSMTDDPDPSHEPKYFDLYQHFDNYADLDHLLHKYQDVLGISNEDLKTAGPEGTTIMPGFVHDWLSLEVEVRTSVNGGWNIIYDVAVDEFHNAAVDKVLHGSKLTLDLRHKPTRADLGFLPTYDQANVWPTPGTAIEVTLITDHGTATIPMNTLMTSWSDGTGPQDMPTRSALSMSSTTAHVKAHIPAVCAAFGLDAAAARSAIDKHQKKVFHGKASSAVAGEIRIGSSDGGGITKYHAASIGIILTYS